MYSKSFKFMRFVSEMGQREFAEKCGIATQTVVRLEKTPDRCGKLVKNAAENIFKEKGITFTQDGDYGVIRFPLENK